LAPPVAKDSRVRDGYRRDEGDSCTEINDVDERGVLPGPKLRPAGRTNLNSPSTRISINSPLKYTSVQKKCIHLSLTASKPIAEDRMLNKNLLQSALRKRSSLHTEMLGASTAHGGSTNQTAASNFFNQPTMLSPLLLSRDVSHLHQNGYSHLYATLDSSGAFKKTNSNKYSSPSMKNGGKRKTREPTAQKLNAQEALLRKQIEIDSVDHTLYGQQYPSL